MNINRVVVSGNLTRDPELRNTQSGMAVASLRIAVNGREKGGDGEWQDRPDFFDVTVWGKQAESCAQYLSKGKPIVLEGRLRLEEWEDKETGGNRSAVKIVADRVQFLGTREDGPVTEHEQYVPASDFTPPSVPDDEFPF